MRVNPSSHQAFVPSGAGKASAEFRTSKVAPAFTALLRTKVDMIVTTGECRLSGDDEDAEGMPGGVGIDAQRLDWILRPVVEQAAA